MKTINCDIKEFIFKNFEIHVGKHMTQNSTHLLDGPYHKLLEGLFSWTIK